MCVEALFRPAMGSVHSLPYLFLGRSVGDALVEAHGYIGSQFLLISSS